MKLVMKVQLELHSWRSSNSYSDTVPGKSLPELKELVGCGPWGPEESVSAIE